MAATATPGGLGWGRGLLSAAGPVSEVRQTPPLNRHCRPIRRWAITSLALQAREALLCVQGSNPAPEGIGIAAAGPSLSADKLLTLAATMAARQVERSHGHISYESLLLYLDILHGQGQPNKALELLEGPLGEAAVPLPADRAALHAVAAACASDLARAAAVWREALLSNPDDWPAWLLYLDCVLPGSAAQGGVAAAAPSGSRFPVGVVGGLADIADRMQRRQQQRQQGADEVAAGVAAAEATLAELGAKVEGDDARRTAAAAGSLRTPLLAPLELLLRRLVLAGVVGSDALAEERQVLLQALAEGVLGACRRLGHTFSCVPDLRMYLAPLATSPAHAAWLAKELRLAGAEAATSNGSSVPDGDPTTAAAPGDTGTASGSSNGNGNGASSAAVQQLQRVVNARLLEHELGLPIFSSAAEAEAYASELLDLYKRHLPLSGGLAGMRALYG